MARKLAEKVPTLTKQDGLRMCAANRAEIPDLGRKVTRFRESAIRKPRNEEPGFNRRVGPPERVSREHCKTEGGPHD